MSKTDDKKDVKVESKDKDGVAHTPGNKLDPTLLEEDDEFEEFPVEDWKAKDEEDEQDVNVWEDNWDDEAVEDDFSKQLRAELERTGHQSAPAPQN